MRMAVQGAGCAWFLSSPSGKSTRRPRRWMPPQWNYVACSAAIDLGEPVRYQIRVTGGGSAEKCRRISGPHPIEAWSLPMTGEKKHCVMLGMCFTPELAYLLRLSEGFARDFTV